MHLKSLLRLAAMEVCRRSARILCGVRLCILAAVGLVLILRAPLQLIILSVQVMAAIMLPAAIIFLPLLLNQTELLGD
jgi:hypothetical protein